MVTFLAGGTGTPKLLAGARRVFDPAGITVVGNTGDDVEIAGHLVCPDIDTVLFEGAGMLDLETWWGIEGDTAETHEELLELGEKLGADAGPRYLDDAAQTEGRDIARWRRFSGVAEFMHIGDTDRALHLTRTGLIDEGHTLTEATRELADAFGLELDVVPMSDDPVATIVETPTGEIHFQEFWISHRAEPEVLGIEFRGADRAAPSKAFLDAIRNETVVVGPSNPVTSIGPMLALDGVREALDSAQVVAVSPFCEDEVFSGPADDLMAGTGREPSTAGVAGMYEFADAFVLDAEDGTELDRPVVRTDTKIEDADDAERVVRAAMDALP